MMKIRIYTLLLTLLSALTTQAQNTATWVATDGLGRTLPSATEVPLKHDGKPRTVGIFYVTWHTPHLHDGHPYEADVTKVLEANPEARSNDAFWPRPSAHGSYHWGEPEYGYFLSQDRYVLRHDLSMLADAGVDVLVLDVTNAVCYWDEWEALFQTMDEMQAEGNRVPKFCFWAFNGNVITVVQSLYERYYKTPRYQDHWFYWHGKPLLLYNDTPSIDANPGGGEKMLADYSPEVKEFFTLRGMWWGYYQWAGQRYVGTEDHWSFGLDLGEKAVADLKPEELCARHEGRLEEMPVTPAQHPMSLIGKSWTRKGGQPAFDTHDMPVPTFVPAEGEVKNNPTQYGLYFQERWDEALQVDPDFVFLNDWNEWTAGKYRNGKDPSGKADLHINFLGRTDNPFYFVDQYNAEFNRTIAPMRGGWTDNYYMQMVQNIRRYKGVEPMPKFVGYSPITLDGDLGEWPLQTCFTDTRGDIIHRNHDGYGDTHYTDSTGRNDIVSCRVAVDKRNIYFAAQTASALTPATDPNWMLLFIDADQDAKTGWEGYDYVINRRTADPTHTTLMRWQEGQWVEVALLPMAVKDNILELSVPRKLLRLKGNHLSLDFKWADNPSDLRSIISLCTTGDTAPNRRFNYRFVWEK